MDDLDKTLKESLEELDKILDPTIEELASLEDALQLEPLEELDLDFLEERNK